MRKIAIIIPAYNEEKRIGNTLERYSACFDSLRKEKKIDYEILIVINNTKDKTEEIVKKHEKKNKRIKHLNLIKGGKGLAVIEGFKNAIKKDSDLIGFVDADMATSPEEFFSLAENIKDYDGAIASRYIKGAIVNPLPTIQRIISSRIFNMLIRALFFFPYRDTQCGAKIFKKHAVEQSLSKLSMSQWAFDVELLYNMKKNNFRIIESPTKWSDREYSKINFMKEGPWMALGAIRLRMINSPLKRFVRIYDKFWAYAK